MSKTGPTQADLIEFLRVEAAARTAKGAIRQAEIVEATIRCLSERGIAGTTFEAIGDRLKLGKAHIAYHFPDLDQLLLLALKWSGVTGQWFTRRRWEAARDDRGRLNAIIEAPFDWYSALPQHTSTFFLLIHLANHHPTYRVLLQDIRRTGQARIAACLTARKRETAAERTRRAAAIQALITGTMVDVTAESYPGSPTIARKSLIAACAALN